MKPLQITETEYRVLKAIQGNPRIRPGGMAELVWPDSVMHTKYRGRKAPMIMGSYLGKVQRRKLVKKYPPFESQAYIMITELGWASLKKYREGMALNHSFTKHQKFVIKKILEGESFAMDLLTVELVSQTAELIEMELAYLGESKRGEYGVLYIPDAEIARIEKLVSRCIVF